MEYSLTGGVYNVVNASCHMDNNKKGFLITLSSLILVMRYTPISYNILKEPKNLFGICKKKFCLQ